MTYENGHFGTGTVPLNTKRTQKWLTFEKAQFWSDFSYWVIFILKIKGTNQFLDQVLDNARPTIQKEIDPIRLPEEKVGFSKKIIFVTGIHWMSCRKSKRFDHSKATFHYLNHPFFLELSYIFHDVHLYMYIRDIHDIHLQCRSWYHSFDDRGGITLVKVVATQVHI